MSPDTWLPEFCTFFSPSICVHAWVISQIWASQQQEDTFSLIGLFGHTVSCVALEIKRLNVCVHSTCQRDRNVWTILLVWAVVRACTPAWLTRPSVWRPPVCLGWPWLLNWTKQREICPRNQTSEPLWRRPQAVQTRQTSPPEERRTVSMTVMRRGRWRIRRRQKQLCYCPFLCSVCGLLERPESNMWCSLLL